MARRNTYSAELETLYAAKNQAARIKSDDQYRKEVLSETIRSNQEKERIQRETLANQLTMSGAYRDRATDKTGDLMRSLSTTERGQDLRYNLGARGQDFTYALGSRGQDLTYKLGARGQDVTKYGIDTRKFTTMRGQDVTSGIAKMRDETDRLGIGKRFELGMAGVSKDLFGIKTRADTAMRGQDWNRLNIKDQIASREKMLGRKLTHEEKMQTSLFSHQDMMQDKRYGLEGGLIGLRAKEQKGVISHEYNERDILAGKEFTRTMKRDAYGRETQKILLNDRLNSTEKMNRLDNLTRVTLQGMGDKTKKEIKEMDLEQRRLEIESALNRDDLKVTQGLMASGTEPTPFISSEREGDYFAWTDEDAVVDEFKAWDTAQKSPAAGKQISVFNKAVSLARQKGQQANPYTQSVIDNYIDAHTNLNRKDMGELFGGSNKRIKVQNSLIRQRLKELYSAQGFTATAIKGKLDELKDRF